MVTIAGVSPSGTKTVIAIPDATHITFSVPVTVAAGAALQDCVNTNFDTDATNLWHAQAGLHAATAARPSTSSSTPATTRRRCGRSSAR